MQVEECFIKIEKHNVLKRVFKPNYNTPRYAVVLIHGIGDHTGQYYDWIQSFIQSGAVFYTFDLPGHGCSDGTRGHIGSIEDIEKIIDHLIANVEPSMPILLYGHSMGAVLALRYIHDRNPKLTGLILTSPWIGLLNPPGKIPLVCGRIARSLFPSMTVKTGIRRFQLYPNTNNSNFSETDSLAHGKISLDTFFQVWDSLHLIEDVPKMEVQTAFVYSKNDLITDVSATEKFAMSMGDKATIISVENEVHNIHLGEHRIETARKINDWINQILKHYDS
ncbi:MAG TPA: alpha/beta fold hydrolase [Salinivirgaceae bacterium]|nr:alpha/beta fold hydrolase [Salinivirgaceae bacterium]